MKTRQIITFIIISFTSIACSNKIKTTPPVNDIITFNQYKGRCMTCPVYSITIKPDYKLEYIGKENVTRLDTIRQTITKKQYDNLIVELNKKDFKSYEDTYFSKARDLPITNIKYQGKSIRFQEKECPKTLQNFVKLINSLVRE